MAWIESHQELRNHPKTKRLARKLDIQPAAAIGHLHCLWWWSADYAPDGDLTEFDDWEIADAAGYEGDNPAEFKDALIFAGFLDNTNQGTLLLHDWMDYAGKNLKKREQARERSQRYRDKQAANIGKTQETGALNANETDTEKEQNATVTHTQRIRSDTVRTGNAPTEHNITEHNSTVDDSTEQESNTPPLSPASGGGDAEPSGKPPDLQEQRFDAFWKLYPKKQGKGAALKAWKKIKPDKALFERIMTAVQDNLDRNQQWRRDNGQYIPNPSTWLNQQRWLDELQSQQRGGAANATGRTDGADRQRIGGADNPAEFQRSTGFRSADSGTADDG